MQGFAPGVGHLMTGEQAVQGTIGPCQGSARKVMVLGADSNGTGFNMLLACAVGTAHLGDGEVVRRSPDVCWTPGRLPTLPCRVDSPLQPLGHVSSMDKVRPQQQVPDLATRVLRCAGDAMADTLSGRHTLDAFATSEHLLPDVASTA